MTIVALLVGVVTGYMLAEIIDIFFGDCDGSDDEEWYA